MCSTPFHTSSNKSWPSLWRRSMSAMSSTGCGSHTSVGTPWRLPCGRGIQRRVLVRRGAGLFERAGVGPVGVEHVHSVLAFGAAGHESGVRVGQLAADADLDHLVSFTVGFVVLLETVVARGARPRPAAAHPTTPGRASSPGRVADRRAGSATVDRRTSPGCGGPAPGTPAHA